LFRQARLGLARRSAVRLGEAGKARRVQAGTGEARTGKAGSAWHGVAS